MDTDGVRRPTIRDRIHYRFDTLMSRGTAVLVVSLWLASGAMILLITAALMAVGLNPVNAQGQPASFAEVAWMCLMRTLDGGTMGSDTGAWGFLLAMLFVTTCGILVMSLLVGILTSGIDQRLREMRKGRSFVVERNHVVVLGWTEQIGLILRELLLANEFDRRFRAVVLAPRDKVEMEDDLRRRLDPRQLAKVVCRTGDPTDMKDLEIVNPEAARAIIVLPGGSAAREALTIQTVMALSTAARHGERLIVTQAEHPATARLLELVARRGLQAVASSDLAARLAAQTCRQPGLAAVYHDLMNFVGNEIYLCPGAAVTGSAFGDVLLAFANAVPIGIRRADGTIRLNPPMTTRIVDGDALIAIGAGLSDVRFTGFHRGIFDAAVINTLWSHTPPARHAERTLLLGWNGWSAKFLQELDLFVPPGSSALVVSQAPRPEDIAAQLPTGLQHLTVEVRAGEASDRAALESLGVDAFDHVLVLADAERLAPDTADARSLVILLYLREIAARCGHRFSVTSEILVEKNREVLAEAGVDDLISTAQVGSLMITQVVQNPEISRVFASLFDPAGSEFYLKPAENYIATGVPVDFYTVIMAAREHGEIAVGYHPARRRGGLVFNPVKTDRVLYTPGDRLVVLAED